MTAEPREVAAEFLGTAALLAVVVGSGIMADRLSPANLGVALLANALVTGLGLFVLVTVFAPASGAHFNPVVTLAAWIQRECDARTALAYVAAQCLGVLSRESRHPISPSSSLRRDAAWLWGSGCVAFSGVFRHGSAGSGRTR